MKRLLFIFLYLIPTLLISQPTRYYYNFDSEAVKLSEELVNAEMGVMEIGNNRGKHIQKYALSALGYKAQGYPYCLAGQYWAIHTACIELNVINYLLRTAHCNTLYNYAMKTGTRDYDVNYKTHDLIIWKVRNGSSGHVERIKSIKNKKLGIVTTYAFNTSVKGGQNVRDGGGNAIKTRHLKHPLGRMFVRGFIGINGK